MAIEFELNGAQVVSEFDPETPLLWVLRDEMRLTGSKFGCGIAQCGACTVHVNGQPRRSCVTPAGSIEGASVVTIEGVTGDVSEAVQSAWREIDVPQCGYCQSGQVMSAIALLSQVPNPSDADIDGAMTGNVCRCATYVRIRQAIKNAAKEIEDT